MSGPSHRIPLRRHRIVAPPPPGHRNLDGDDAAAVSKTVTECIDAITAAPGPLRLNIVCSVLATLLAWTEDPEDSMQIIGAETIRVLRAIRH